MSRVSLQWWILALLALPPVLLGQDDRFAAALAKIESAVPRQMALDQTPAVSIAFMKDDFQWARGFGFADLENRVPATEKSAYRLASVTKPMTAAAILQLVERGLVDLDREVQAYVPYFPRKNSPVTVRQLLGHLGGISHYKNAAAELHLTEPKTTREAIAIFQDFDLVAEPGTRYNYSSYGYNLLGAVIEGASGMSYGDYMRQYVWQPLGMHDTRLDDPYDLIPHRVRGYQLVNGEIKNSEFVNISSRFAAGGTRSTVLDMIKFAHGLNTGKLLAPASLEQMYESMATHDGRFTDYGMGWGTGNRLGHFMLRHSGGQNETRTMLYNYPCCRFIVAVACNFEAANPATYADLVVTAVLGEPTHLESYSPDRLTDAMLFAMEEVFASGLNYFKQFGRPLTSDSTELAQAFSYFNQQVRYQALQADYDGSLQKIRAGRHPLAKQAFRKIGSYLAAKIQEQLGEARLQSHHQNGAVTFFHDYLELARRQPAFPAALRFPRDFEERLSRWQRDWQRTWNAEVRALALAPKAELTLVKASLPARFAGAQIYPDFSRDYLEALQQCVQQGEYAQALAVGRDGVALYPSAEELQVQYGVTLILAGEKEKGLAQLKTLVAEQRHAAGPESMIRIASQLSQRGRHEQAIALLQVALLLHPHAANLFDRLGELYLMQGRKADAVAQYKKALGIDPNLENAKRMLEKLSQ